MSSRISQPLSQQPHSNVAVVRYKAKNKKFEIACYKNMVLSYRSGQETKLSNVLQIERVFTNVSHGKFASQQELAASFGTQSTSEVIRTILLHGELQVAELERAAEHERTWNTLAEFVAENCVNPRTKRKYSIPLIEKAMRAVGFSIRSDFSWKRQALIVIKRLIKEQPMPISRAQIKVRITSKEDFLQSLPAESYEVLDVDKRDDCIVQTLLIDAFLLHDINVLKESHELSVCILESAVAAEGDGNINEISLESPAKIVQKPVPVEEVDESNRICGFLSNQPLSVKKEPEQKSLRKAGSMDPQEMPTTNQKKLEKRSERKKKGLQHCSAHRSDSPADGELESLLAQLDAKLS